MNMLISYLMLAGTMAATTEAPPPTQTRAFVCKAQSIIPRDGGIIISQVFESRRASPAWLRQAFINYLRTNYAPYGNTWRFRDESAECVAFVDRPAAQKARDTAVLLAQRANQAIFNVGFIG